MAQLIKLKIQQSTSKFNVSYVYANVMEEKLF